MIETRNLTFQVGERKLLDSIDIHIRAGELTALCGPNGAGKSTLLSAMCGDIQPTTGSVLIDGNELARYSAAELAKIRAVFPQAQILTFAFSVEEIVRMGRSGIHLDPKQDGCVVTQRMQETEVEHLRYRNALTLSGGEHARTTMSRVLVQETPVLLLDEPTAALDLRHQERVMAIARAMADQGCTVVVVVHDLNLAGKYADRVVLMADGKLAADGAPWDVLTATTVSDVYHQQVLVMPHPNRNCPIIVTA